MSLVESLALGLVLLFLAVAIIRLFKTPLKIALRTVGNTALGFGALWALNLTTAYTGHLSSRKDTGIFVHGANVKISNCEFASFSGAGIRVSSTGSGSAEDCYFHNCKAGVSLSKKAQLSTERVFFSSMTPALQLWK